MDHPGRARRVYPPSSGQDSAPDLLRHRPPSMMRHCSPTTLLLPLLLALLLHVQPHAPVEAAGGEGVREMKGRKLAGKASTSFCTGKTGNFQDPADCRSYIVCAAGSQVGRATCASTLLFNQRNGVCDWPSNVQCIGSSASPPPPPSFCTGRGTRNYQDPADCRSFIQCVGGTQVGRQTCVQGTLFNQNKGVCDWPYNVQCVGTTSPSPSPSPPPVRPSPPPPSPSPSPSPPPSSSSSGSCCTGRSDGYHQDPSDCSKYCICLGGKQLASLSCGRLLRFSEEAKVCDFPSNVVCRGQSGTPSPPPPPPTSTASCCFGKPNGYYQSPTDCSKYCICVNGKAVATLSCPWGLRFNDQFKVCDYSTKVVCSNSTTAKAPPPPPPSSTASCCPSKATGYYQNPSDCGRFCICVSGQEVASISCPSGLLFNKRVGVCDWALNVQCGSTNTTVISQTVLAVANRTAGLVPSAAVVGGGSVNKLNRFSRHASVAVPSPSQAVDWSAVQNAATPVKEQGPCGVCWAFSAAAAIETAVAINQGQTAAVSPLSVQQLVDCSSAAAATALGGVTGVCRSGTAGDALAFAATKGSLATNLTYPFLGNLARGTCLGSALTQVGKVVAYEQVAASEVALMAAVTQQPVIVGVQSRVTSFVQYPGGVYADPLCDTGSLDHSVVVMGFGTTSDGQPYWLLRNSWGVGWGEGGYMRMLRAGGRGICGITSMPGLYPVVTSSSAQASPCGLPNPCGGGTCTPSGSTYTCSCPSSFVSVTNTDGTPTCAPVDACGASLFNPCGPGQCANDNQGGYSCTCSDPFKQGTRPDGSATCVPLSDTGAPTCTSMYTSNANDTCGSIAAFAGITEDQLVSLNPGLVCSRLSQFPGQQICTSAGLQAAKVCKFPQRTYAVLLTDSCGGIITFKFKRSVQLFMSLNQFVCIDRSLFVGLILCLP